MRVFLLVFFFPALAWSWDLNDISILVPLPAVGEESMMLHPTSNELLPKAVFDKLQVLVINANPQDIYDRLMAVAIRIDPCFHEGSSPCQHQVRMVWQPFVRAGPWMTLDA